MIFILSSELVKVEFPRWDDLKLTFQVLARQTILPDEGLALETYVISIITWWI